MNNKQLEHELIVFVSTIAMSVLMILSVIYATPPEVHQ
jgi:hypothetical protein